MIYYFLMWATIIANLCLILALVIQWMIGP